MTVDTCCYNVTVMLHVLHNSFQTVVITHRLGDVEEHDCLYSVSLHPRLSVVYDVKVFFMSKAYFV